MKEYRGWELKAVKDLAAKAMEMIIEDSKGLKDGGTCVIGAGIAIHGIPPRCRNPRMIVITRQTFQGEGACKEASERAMKWLKDQGIACFWYGGRMD